MPKLPDAIGRFKIVDRIAQGGMGALYLAWDPTLERQIAIKLLRDDSDELRERFSREAKFVARLRHPRIVTVFDVGEHDGQPFIAMEYVQGNTLADIVRAETPLSVGVKLKWVEELCDGLGFAHRAGIVHRDVKPANMIVDAEGSIKILDFGIARDGPGRTQAGMLIGSLNYMSPEQVLGRPVDQRCDVFAVGGVLYELLTYRQAFPGGLDSGILTKILHDAPAPLLSIRPELDGDIVHIVERALEKDPANRYQEIQSMQRDLLRILRQFDASETRVDSGVTAVIFPPVPLRPTPPRTPRREPDRAALERRRAEQIQAHLETARAATSASDYKSAIAACEQALLLDSQHPMATELLEQANAALDARRAGEYLDEAQRQLEAGALTSATDLVQQAFNLGETSFRAFLLRDAIEEAHAKREREQQRLEAGKKAVARACGLFEAGSFDEAVSAADEALTLLPGDATALSIKQRATAAADARRLERLNERARITTAEARRLFAAGDHAEALNLLEGFDPRNHEDVARTLDELETTLRTIERQVQGYLAEASAAVSARDLDRAAACVREALALEPAHERARAMDGAIREQVEQRELEERLERERQQAVAAKLEKAAQTTSHEEALVLINGALALDPQNEEARRSLESRSVALVNERARITTAEARRLFAAGEHAEALNRLEGFDPRNHEDVVRTFDELETRLRAIERQVQEYLADASAAVSAHDLDRAAASVCDALALDPANERARAMEGAIREQVRQRELEERLERERQQAVAAKLEKAAQTTSHEEALILINGALALDPQNEEARRSLESRSVALVNERARITTVEARRLFAAGNHAEALNRLEGFDPRNHEDVVRTFDELETTLRAIERQVQEYLADASAAVSAHDLDRAAASVCDALALDPANERARAMEGAIREQVRQRELEERLERERQQAVAAKLEKAAQTTSHEEALILINGALVLDPQNEEARRSLESRSVALVNERARITTVEARRLFAAGEHAEALNLLEGFDARDHGDIARTVDELRTLLRAIEQQVQEQLAEASAAVSAHDLDRAAASVREALVLKPADERARAMDEQISHALRERAIQRELEERLERERQQAVAAKLGKAAQATSHEEALVLIKGALELDPRNEEARRSLEIRSAALEQQRAAERRRKQIDSACQRIEEMLAGDDLDAVETALNEADDGGDAQRALAPLRRQLASKRLEITRRELAAVHQREREQAIAEALDRANRAVSHEVAVAAYRQILDLEPGHQFAQQGLSMRQAALEKERLVAAALDRVAAAASDSEAVTALRAVLELQPDLPDVLRQLQDREAALARQQEEARQKRHDDLIAGRVARVATIPSHAAALVQLRKILDLDPANAEARRLLDLRELALKAEQEAQEQPQEVEADEKRAPQADEDDQTNPLEVIRPDGVPHIPTSSQGWVDRWLSFGDTARNRTYVVGAVAAAIILIILIILAYGMSERESASSDAVNNAPAPPQQSASAPSQIDPAPPKPEEPPPVATTPAPPALPKSDDPPPDPVDPAVELENRLGPIRALARRQVNQGNHRQAVGTIVSGLKLQPDDAVLRRMLADMAQNAIAAASVARDSAVSAGFGVENLPRYRDGRMKEQEGLRLAPRRPGVAVYALWDAASLYSEAAEEARRAKPQQAPLAVPPAPAPVAPPPTARKAEADPPAVRPPVVQPQAPATTAASIAASIAADEAAIRAVLRGYERGYGALSVPEITRVYPGINADALAENFKLMRAYSVEIINPRISMVGSTATVVCQVRQRYTPHVGSRGQSTVNSTFQLVKRGDAWVIVDRR